jgi:hypothetical protein
VGRDREQTDAVDTRPADWRVTVQRVLGIPVLGVGLEYLVAA